ncbi:MAG: threonine aldolase family protein [Gemmatimonadaceae bacterium]|nr:threonine aldolase family protein [Gemmatimonadaceae bacterium]
MPIDLRSDTVTRPTARMREAMVRAEVGDDVLDGDPTVQALEARVAALLGMETALFFPSGTMANMTGLWLAGEPGTEVYCDARAHVLDWEIAGAAVFRGVQLRPIVARTAVIDADDVRAALRPPSRYAPRASALTLENTHNGAGGAVTAVDTLAATAAVAREHGLAVHLDGARLWNAHVATGTPLADFARVADTVMVSFSKGLGAPVGAALACAQARRDEAWEVRKRFGGGMRQSGILAAAALHALEYHLERLAEDHHHAREFAREVHGAGEARVVPPDTNIVMIDCPPGVTATDVVARARDGDVLLSPWSATRVRAVFHLDVSAADAARAAAIVAATVSDLAAAR